MHNEKLARLKEVLSEKFPTKEFALAFSGGLDSRFLAFTAKQEGFDVHLFHITGPHLPVHESQSAKVWAEKHGFKFFVYYINPLENECVLANGKDRCYHCKNYLFSFLAKQTARTFADGTNFSDTLSYRPGMRALEEHHVISPLREAGLLKSEIRVLADSFGLEAAYQPSTTCLLTRFNYGVQPDEATMHALGEAEKAIYEILYAHFGTKTALRIRIVNGVPALHLLSDQMLHLTELDKVAIRHVFFQVAPIFDSLDIVGLPALSGFFDEASKEVTGSQAQALPLAL